MLNQYCSSHGVTQWLKHVISNFSVALPFFESLFLPIRSFSLCHVCLSAWKSSLEPVKGVMRLVFIGQWAALLGRLLLTLILHKQRSTVHQHRIIYLLSCTALMSHCAPSKGHAISLSHRRRVSFSHHGMFWKSNIDFK